MSDDSPRAARRTGADPQPVQDRLEFSGAVQLLPRGGAVPHSREVASRIARGLALVRPLVCLDLEATGLDVVEERIVELTLVRVEPDGRVDTLDTLVRPGRAIPQESTAIHGIADDDVAEAPTFAEVASRLLRLLRGADLCGFNLLRYDLPLLDAELARCDLAREPDSRVVDACVIFKRMERRDLAAAHRFYCGEDPPAAHSASGDVVATMAVLAGQIDRYPELPRDVEGLDGLSRPRR